MASHYDPKKNCRVGIMDEDQFYSEANEKNAKYFKTLIAGWKKKGGKYKWGAGGVGLRCEAAGKEKVAFQHAQASAMEDPTVGSEREEEPAAAKPFTRETRKVGRNEPCPCGSGKKYKQCHGQL